MKRMVSLLICGSLIFSLAACGNSNGGSNPADHEPESEAAGAPALAEESQEGAASGAESTEESNTENELPGGHILVAYFSLAGEQYVVGNIEKGNTQIIAEMIAEETGADLFSIEPVVPYPDTYEELLEVSQQESLDNPPEIAQLVENMEQYDTVFIGSPVWWSDLPAIVAGFLQEYDFSGKTVIPFSTHEGSGLGRIPQTISALVPDAAVLDGLSVRGQTAQESPDEAQAEVTAWLKDLGLSTS